MRRRDFLSQVSLASLGGYSLVVLADESSALAGTGRSTDQIREELARIAPRGGERRAAPDEPHMTLVKLDCDVFVAGGGMAGICAAVAAARNGAKVVIV